MAKARISGKITSSVAQRAAISQRQCAPAAAAMMIRHATAHQRNARRCAVAASGAKIRMGRRRHLGDAPARGAAARRLLLAHQKMVRRAGDVRFGILRRLAAACDAAYIAAAARGCGVAAATFAA
jgi:hypothetical protein